MIRMVLIYAALFAIAAGAIWMKPASNGVKGVAALPEEEFRNLTHLVLTDLGAPGLRHEAEVSRTLLISQRPVQRPHQSSIDQDLSLQVLRQLEIANGAPAPSGAHADGQAPRGLASLVSRSLSQDATGQEIERLVRSNDGAVDLAPLLEVPGSVETGNGTRFLASALIRQQTAQREGLNGVSEVATLSVPPEPPKAERFYTVRAGDSLGSIAESVYGSSSSYRKIFNANRDTLASIDAIRVGQRLRIP